MEQKDAIELVQEIGSLATELKNAYGRRLSRPDPSNPYITAARAKMEAYNEVLDIIKRIKKL